jgi:uncharacterized membrane protein YfcA
MMHMMHFSLWTLTLLILTGCFAGLLGAMIGIGGGLIVVPALVLGFGVDLKIAIAASLVAVVASSTAAGSVYVGKGLANMRLGMCLEIATTLGGISGGLLAVLIPTPVLSVLFALLMVVTSTLILRSKDPSKAVQPKDTDTIASLDGHESVGSLSGSYYDPFHKTLIHYTAERLHLGSAVSFCAGIMSGLLGVGGGFMKVPAMALGMKVPVKVAAATSNFMIGVTAASSLFVYFSRGLIHPLIAAPIAIGITIGAIFGTSVAQKVSPTLLRKIMSVLMILTAIEFFLKAIGVSLGS